MPRWRIVIDHAIGIGLATETIETTVMVHTLLKTIAIAQALHTTDVIAHEAPGVSVVVAAPRIIDIDPVHLSGARNEALMVMAVATATTSEVILGEVGVLVRLEITEANAIVTTSPMFRNQVARAKQHQQYKID